MAETCQLEDHLRQMRPLRALLHLMLSAIVAAYFCLNTNLGIAVIAEPRSFVRLRRSTFK